MAILLIRHGETAGNANRVVQHPETPLSERGLEQAARLGERLREHEVGAVLASDYARAAMTAEAVRQATSAPLSHDASLRERNLGDLRGRPYSEFDFDPFAPDYVPPNGESWEVFHRRVDRAWQAVERAAAECERNLAVVTHGLVCASIVTRLVALADGVELQGGWTNTSLTVIEGGGPGAGRWEVRLLNCSAHLDEARETGPA